MGQITCHFSCATRRLGWALLAARKCGLNQKAKRRGKEWLRGALGLEKSPRWGSANPICVVRLLVARNSDRVPLIGYESRRPIQGSVCSRIALLEIFLSSRVCVWIRCALTGKLPYRNSRSLVGRLITEHPYVSQFQSQVRL